jgi:large subunit ribosomal protein L33
VKRKSDLQLVMAKENREMVWLQCTETGDLNYRTEIKVAGGAPKIELKKYSSVCASIRCIRSRGNE